VTILARIHQFALGADGAIKCEHDSIAPHVKETQIYSLNHVIASEAWQSSFSISNEFLDCHVATLLAMTV